MIEKELDEAKLELERARLELEHKKVAAEIRLQEQDLELKRKDQERAGWLNPLVVAIFAAAVAAAGNAVVSTVNGIQQREIEDRKSEQTRILEMIKTGDTEKAAENLRFLLEAGLIDNPDRATKVKAYLEARRPGTGPALPSGAITGGIVGADDAVDVNSLPSASGVRIASRSVGLFEIVLKHGEKSACTAFLVGSDLALTAGHCSSGAQFAVMELSDAGGTVQYAVQLPPVAEFVGPHGTFSLLRLSGHPGGRFGVLALSPDTVEVGDSLAAIYFRGDGTRKLAVLSPDCRVLQTEEQLFHHGCDTGVGSSGAPLLSRDGQRVLGVHRGRTAIGGGATRADVIIRSLRDYLEPK